MLAIVILQVVIINFVEGVNIMILSAIEDRYELEAEALQELADVLVVDESNVSFDLMYGTAVVLEQN